MKFLHKSLAFCAGFTLLGCTAVLGGEDQDKANNDGGGSADGRGQDSPVAGGGSSGNGSLLDGTLGTQPLALGRLTQRQYRHVIQDTFGEDFAGELDLERDHYDEGFASVGARQVAVSRLGVSKYESAAIAIAKEAGTVARYESLSGCPAADLSAGCVDGFLQKIGGSLFRRPLTDGELARYRGVVTAAQAATSDPKIIIETVLTGLLLSPHFLYHHDAATVTVGTKSLAPLALASKLSFLLWDSGPDAALIQAAVGGSFETDEQIAFQIDRLLADTDRLKRGIEAFALGYLALHRLGESTKDPELFPEFTDELMESMGTAALLSVTDVVVDRDETFDELLIQTTNFVDARIAEHTGATPPAEGFVRFDYGPDSLRGGLLSEPAIMALTSRAFDTSPTLRGIFVRELLCDEVPPPPANVNTSLPEVTEPLTRRAQFEMHLSVAACSSCHSLMDPPGYALEYFDPIGRFRELDSGFAIDATGELDGVSFEGPRELAATVVSLPRFRECLTEKLLIHALGHPLPEAPGTPLHDLVELLDAWSGRLQPLLREVALSPEFRAVPDQL